MPWAELLASFLLGLVAMGLYSCWEVKYGAFSRSEFYSPERRDLILKPLDARCPYWSLGEEIGRDERGGTAAAIAAAFLPDKGYEKAFFRRQPAQDTGLSGQEKTAAERHPRLDGRPGADRGDVPENAACRRILHPYPHARFNATHPS